MSSRPDRNFVWKTALCTLIASVAVTLLAVLWFAADVFLILFAGLLFAVFLGGFSSLLRRWTGLGPSSGLAAVVLLLFLILIVSFALIAGSVALQADEFSKQLPQSEEAFRSELQRFDWGRRLESRLPSFQQLVSQASGSKTVSRISNVFSSTLGALANVVIIFFIGLYVAANPDWYRRGLLRLASPQRRPKFSQVLDEVGSKLWWWLLGRLFAMVVISVATAVALSLLGIPAAFALALLAGVLNFIPNIGPLISFVPAALMAIVVGPMHVLYVALLYLSIQLVESYLLTPQIEKRTVELPPALTIFMQVLLGVLLGFGGLALATPLTAAGLVLVQELYVYKIERSDNPNP